VSTEPPTNATPDPEKSVLAKASNMVFGPRQEAYGPPHENHGRTAAFWSAYLGIPITRRQVCILNMLQKIARDMHAPKFDNLVDIAGYAENAELAGPEPAPEEPYVFREFSGERI
jgi:hypothetical protein